MSIVLKETDKYIIISNLKNNCNRNLFCNVCTYALKTSFDMTCNENFDCCHDCYLRFCESRKKEWKEGWRPKKEDIEAIIYQKDRILIK